MKSLSYLNPYFIKYKYRLIFGICFVIVSNLFSAIPAQSVRKAVDLIASFVGNNLQVTEHEFYTQLVVLMGLVIAMALLRGMFMFLMRQSIIVMSRLIEYDLKNEVFKHYQKLSPAFYLKNSTGDLMARISEDVSRVRMYIGPAVMYYTNLIATFLVVIPLMFSVHVKLAFWVLLPLPILSVAIFYVNNIINKKGDNIQRKLSLLTSTAQETFSGIRVIKAFGAESYFKQIFVNQSNQYLQSNMSLAKVDATFFPLMGLLTGVSVLITVWLGGYYVIANELTLGNILEFVIYVNLLTWPVTSLGYTTSLVQRAAASQARINEFLLTEPDIKQGQLPVNELKDEIKFSQVSFTYPGMNQPALNKVSLSIKRGKTIAVVGNTGSGKTTLIQLLLRNFDVTEGEVLIDGKNLKQLDLTLFKSNLGYVSQDVFLFSDSILNNVAFGAQRKVSQNEIENVCELAAVHQNIVQFKEGYQTIIGERGVTLSGGQKQRLSIARALIAKPEFLIFDDCFSALDTETESAIIKNLFNQPQKPTILLVSHRISGVTHADHIVVLNKGSVVEEGNHTQLLALNGYYANLYQTQITQSKNITA